MTAVSGGGELLRLAIAILWACAIACLLWRALRQFRAYEVIGPRRDLDLGAAPSLAVIVPARDEAAVIGRCLAGLLAQDYPAGRLRLIVVDDESRDATAAIVRRMARGAAHLTLLTARPLPPGWTGKPHACWQGALAAESDWLCFMDADTCAEPALMRSALAAALEHDADMISLEPAQELGSFWERLIMPAGLFAVACARDLRRTADPRAPDASVNGQFLLVRGAAYFAVGGHAAVRAEVCEDSALARRIKAAGYRLRLFGTDRLVRTRMYGDLRSLWLGLVKNASEVFGGALPTLAVALGGIAVAAAAPLVPAWIAADPGMAASPVALAALARAATASLVVLASQLAAARYFGISWGYGMLFPIAYVAAAVLAFHSVLARARGRVLWKGRLCRVQRGAAHGKS